MKKTVIAALCDENTVIYTLVLFSGKTFFRVCRVYPDGMIGRIDDADKHYLNNCPTL